MSVFTIEKVFMIISLLCFILRIFSVSMCTDIQHLISMNCRSYINYAIM